MTEGVITKSEKGAITIRGSKNPVNIYDPYVLIIIKEAGIKLWVKMPLVPTKAASHAMFGNVGWCPEA